MSGHSGKDSLDFYNLEGSDLNSATRQSFRVSISRNDKYCVEIDQNKYPLVDASVNGVSFYANSGKEFPIGTIVSGCKLTFDKNSINTLKGKIVHNSSEPADNDQNIGNQWLCGVLWEGVDSDKEKLLLSGFETLKKDILDRNDVRDMDE
jgi:hypothetical protein